jgi:hypothetical protein
MFSEEGDVSVVLLALQMCPDEQQAFVIDTGCSQHMFTSSNGTFDLKNFSRLIKSC